MLKSYHVLLVVSGLLCLFSCKKESSGGETEVKPIISIEDASVEEGNSGSTFLSFALKMNQSTSLDISVTYQTREVTASEGQDFKPANDFVIIPAGQTQGEISIEIIPDDDFEEDEQFEISISNPINVEISSSNRIAVGTIRNDDSETIIGDMGYSTPNSYPGMTLVWADEFDGTSLNTDDWTYETGDNGWGNNELQNYLSGTNNATVADGRLTIEAKKVGSSYTSARIKTQGKQSFQYGRIDIRAVLPQGQGIWPALWMLGENFSTTGWPACGEIDIMELVGHEPDKVYGTAHWENQGSHAEFGGNKELSSGVFADEFHVFSIIWDAQEITWLLDDVPYHAMSITPSELSEFKEEFFFIFNVAVGGNWPGSPNATTQFPQKMIVDYVRVFQ